MKKTSKRRVKSKSTPNLLKYLVIAFILIGLGFATYRQLLAPLGINLIGGLTKDKYDVVVAGAGTGGIGAAIQASRMGSSVLLVEETDWVGGQMTAGGVTSLDYGNLRWVSGIFNEFTGKVKTHYAGIGKDYLYAYWGRGISFEPAVGRDILMQMLAAEPNLNLLTQTKITAIGKSGNQITSVKLSNGKTVQTNNLIDATEYGDMLPLSGATYRLGNSVSTAPNLNACIQDITYLGFIKKYPTGRPEKFHIKTTPPGYTDAIRAVFAAHVIKNGNPPSAGTQTPVNLAGHNSYRGIPDSTNPIVDKPGVAKTITKTGLNWANDYPILNTLNAKYLTDQTYRKQINCEAKLRTIQFLYYVQNELGYTDWGISEEGYDTPYNRNQSCENIPEELKAIEYNLAPIPYVRESLRGVAATTLTAKDVKRAGSPAFASKQYANSIAIGDYGLDLHNCKTDEYLETGLENTADNPKLKGPFQIPLDVLIAKDLDGLILAEKNTSVSRLVNGATRLQPITMEVGQAAGALASLASSSNSPARTVPSSEVQKALINQNVLIYPFFDVAQNHPYSKDIQLGVVRGIMSGYGNLSFGPDDYLKRDQVAVSTVNAFNLPIVTPTQATFADVQNNYWGYKWVESLAASGFTSGCSTNPAKFCPNSNVTNTEMAVFAIRGLAKSDTTAIPLTPATPTYQDVASNFWGYKWIEGLAGKNIKYYCNTEKTRFCPNDPVTRAKATHIFNQVLNLLGR